MDFYLVKDGSLEFRSGNVVAIKDRAVQRRSNPINLKLEPVPDNNEDAQYYSKALINSLIEDAPLLKCHMDMVDQQGFIVSPTLRLFLTLQLDYGPAKVEMMSDVGDTRTSILERLGNVYGEDGVKINLIFNIVNRHDVRVIEFSQKGLSIMVLDDNEKEGLEIYGCESNQVTFLEKIRGSWSAGKYFTGRVTISVSLSNQAVSRLHFEHMFKYRMLNDNKIMLEEGIFSDLVIVADKGVEVKCHKANLAVKSQVLEVMLESNGTNRLEMTEMNEASVRAFLSYVYCLDLENAVASCDIALDLLCAGHKYDMPKLEHAMTTLLCAKLNSWLNVDTAVKLLLFARNLGMEVEYKDKLMNKAFEALKWHSKASPNLLFNSVQYQQLFLKHPNVAMELNALILKLA